MAAVLKTAVARKGTVGSNPSASATSPTEPAVKLDDPKVLLPAVRAIREALPGEGLFYCKRAFLKTGSVSAAIELLRPEYERLRRLR